MKLKIMRTLYIILSSMIHTHSPRPRASRQQEGRGSHLLTSWPKVYPAWLVFLYGYQGTDT